MAESAGLFGSAKVEILEGWFGHTLVMFGSASMPMWGQKSGL
jgi:hypothetical protein